MMRDVRHAWLRRVGSLVLVAALLVPLAVQGHSHGDDAAAARSCAACVVAHSPLLSTAPVAAPEAIVVRAQLAETALVTPRAGHRLLPLVRGPPATPALHIA